MKAKYRIITKSKNGAIQYYPQVKYWFTLWLTLDRTSPEQAIHNWRAQDARVRINNHAKTKSYVTRVLRITPEE